MDAVIEHADLFRVKWMQLRSDILQRFDKLSEWELDLITGNADALIDNVEKHYGYDHNKAIEEVNRFLGEMAAKFA
jgi:hypothetical protein